MDHFGETLRRLLAARKRTQAELALHLKKHQQVISKWSDSPTPPKAETLIRIADWLGVSVDSLLGLGDPQGLSDDERHLLRVFRAIPIDADEAVRRICCGKNSTDVGDVTAAEEPAPDRPASPAVVRPDGPVRPQG